ncbi:MAG: P-loop containing nucleoside triphosphate hydrolase protein [Piptocephalis tieghemiana]|nr:MAG: P-loop containing nucleoside triphosphate hydrolase protein [Piptocephalis tieghemiana]
MALLGELRCVEGRVRLPRGPHGKGVAYVPQQPWLQNATIRDNILFGEPYDLERYAETVKCCALQEDFRQLGAGDQTEVGEKGIALSGGQKQRISLARAVYSRASIVLMDDVLSAVDAHTARHLYEQCLLGPLMRPRTLILVTHYVDLCTRDAALALLLGSRGEIQGIGTPATLREQGILPPLPPRSEEGDDQAHNPDPLSSSPLSIRSPVGSPVEDLASQVMAHRASSPSIQPPKPPSPRPQPSLPAVTSSPDEETSLITGKLTTEESRSRGSVHGAVYRMYFSYSGGYFFWAMILGLFFFTQGLTIFQNYWLSLWVDAYGKEDPEDVGLLYYLGIYALIGAGVIIMDVVKSLTLFSGSVQASRSIHEELMHRILHARVRFFDVTPLGRLMNRFSKDMEVLDQEVAPVLSFFAFAVIETLGVVLVVALAMPQFLLAAFFIALLFYSFSIYYLATSRELKRLESITKSPLLTLFGETMSGVMTIRAFGQEDRFRGWLVDRVDESNRPNYLLWASNRWLSWRVELSGSLVGFSTAGLLLTLGMGIVAAPTAGFIMTYALSFTDHMIWVVRMYGANEMNMNSVERLRELLEVEEEGTTSPTTSTPSPSHASAPQRVEPGWPSKGEVEVKDLVLKYSDDGPSVLKGLSFSVSPGERVGIVGRTGAGKSSLAIAFFRFVEAHSGTITIDGVDIGKLGLRDLRSRLTIIPQDPILFTGTIRSNLDPFDEHDNPAVLEAMRRAHLQGGSHGSTCGEEGEEEEEEDMKLDTPVTEHGGNFSQGQRQLLALARALLRESRLIILDEATASVDFDTDARIQRTIREEFVGSTLLCIAHRLRTIMDYDRVLVMDAGQVVEYDTPWALLQQPDGIFRGMCERSGELEELTQIAKEVASK